MAAELLHQDGKPVPYVTPWDAERVLHPRPRIFLGPSGPFLGYADEVPGDRDADGALFRRQALARGRGKADFPGVHPLRQRRCMRDLLCQVCAAPALGTGPKGLGEGALFLLAGATPIREGERTAAPPVCIEHASLSARLCPRLRPCSAAWVSSAPSWGVAGLLHDPRSLRRVSTDLTQVSYDDPRIRWTIAYRQVVKLHGVVPVQLHNLTTRAQR